MSCLSSCNGGNINESGVIVTPSVVSIPNGESALINVSLSSSTNISESQVITITSTSPDVTAESIGGSCILTNTNRNCQYIINVDEYAYESQYILNITNSGTLKILSGNTITVNLPSWSFVGESNISDNNVNKYGVSSIIGQNNTPYIAYVVGSNNDLEVKKFVNGTWISLGIADTNVTSDTDGEISMFMLNDGRLYVIYNKNDKLYQQIYLNGRWLNTPEYIVDGTGQTVSALGNTAYIAYTESTNYFVQVKQLISDTWVTQYTTTTDYSFTPKVTIANNGNVYVAYVDGYGILNCIKYDRASWINVGNDIARRAVNISIAVNNENIPYISYFTMSGGATFVKYFNNDSWQFVAGNDGDGFLTTGVMSKLIHNPINDAIYVAYVDYFNTLNVQYLINNEQWQNIGNNGIVGYTNSQPSMNISTTGELFVAYKNIEDSLDDDIPSGFASMKSY